MSQFDALGAAAEEFDNGNGNGHAEADGNGAECGVYSQGKIIHDPIHGQIRLEPLLLLLLDTPQFQRLRDLKQLGCAYLVFPGASHNRFEHCIGVAHLAQQLMEHLQQTQPELRITQADILLVKIAGLCHDLGHGPFSHMFEEFVHSANPNSSFRHERMSLQMLEWIIAENNIPINASEIQFLRECINPYDNPTQSNPKKFLYDIVANARNSVDVDKFDYLSRDCFGPEMQVLTSDGFLFGSEIEARVRRGQPLKYAAYDIATRSLVYTTGQFVSHHEENALIDFTHHMERRFSGDVPDSRHNSNGISLQVTADHRLYLVRGRAVPLTDTDTDTDTCEPQVGRALWETVDDAPEIVRAGDLLNGSPSDIIRLETTAAGGITQPAAAQQQVLTALAPLGLGSDWSEKHDAFLELYGFWLGDGSFTAAHGASVPGYVTFSERQAGDLEILTEMYQRLDLHEHRDWLRTYSQSRQMWVHSIKIPAWDQFFHDLYWRKYDHSLVTVGRLPKSAKWFAPWVALLLRDQLRLILRGLHRAGVSWKSSHNTICTSSVEFREELVVLLLHAGYTVDVDVDVTIGADESESRGEGALTQDAYGRGYTAAEAEVAGREEQCKPIEATAAAWLVRFSENSTTGAHVVTQPRLDLNRDVAVHPYFGPVWCVQVDHPDHLIVCRRARINEKHEVVHSSRPVIIGNCHNLGMSTNLKHDRLIQHCRVIDGEICFSSKEVYNLYELFHTRYSLFKQVYSHRVSKSIEYMICDVFHLADPVLKLSQASESPESYSKLTDCILKQIETSTDPDLQAARDLIMRIRRRQLYRLVDETVLPVDVPKVLDEVTPKQILDCYLPSRAVLSEADLHVQNLRINYAMKDKNPVDSIRFFHKSHPNHSFYIPKHKVSHVIPQHFQERILRVFLRDVTQAKLEAASEAITFFLERNNCISPTPPTRSLSSPSALTSAQPIRGGSLFSRMRSHPPTVSNGRVIRESDEEEEEEVSLSQGTAIVDADEHDHDHQPLNDAQFAVALTSYNGRSESVLNRLMAVTKDATPVTAADGSGNTTILAPLPVTPTRNSKQANVDSPPTVKLDRHAHVDDDASASAISAGGASPCVSSTPRSLTFATHASVAAKRPFAATLHTDAHAPAHAPAYTSTLAANNTPAPLRDATCSPCPTPMHTAHTPLDATRLTPRSSAFHATPTPLKKRAVLSKPATPVGKMAAQAAARATTPATATPTALTRITPFTARGTPNAVTTPQQHHTQPQQKRAKITHNLPTPNTGKDRPNQPDATPSPTMQE